MLNLTYGSSSARPPGVADNHGRPLTPAALDHLVRRWFTRAGVLLPRGAAAHAFWHYVDGWVMWPAGVFRLAGVPRGPVPAT